MNVILTIIINNWGVVEYHNTPTTNNKETSPGRTRPFIWTCPVHVVVYMAIIIMSVPSYPRCTKCGKPKQLLEVNCPCSSRLRIFRHLNWMCSQILSLSKDLLLLNLSKVKQPTLLNLLVSVTTRSSWWILMRLIPLISTCKLDHINMRSHRIRFPLSPKPKHLLSLLWNQMVCYRSLNLKLS